MNYNWNLDTLYQGFDDPAFAEDIALLEKTLADFTVFTQDLSAQDSAQTLVRGIELMEKINVLVEKLATYAVLRQTADTRDASVSSRVGQIMNLASAGAAPEAAFKDWASKLPDLPRLVELREELRPYRFYFEDLRVSSRYLLPGMVGNCDAFLLLPALRG